MVPEYELEVFGCNEDNKEDRVKEYFNRGLKLYPTAREISSKNYQELLKSFESRDDKYLSDLMEKSIFYAIKSASEIFAKFKLEDYVSYDEALSFAIEKIGKAISNLDYLPQQKSKFTCSFINYNSYNAIKLIYCRERYRKETELYLKPKDMEWQIDKLDHKDFSFKNLTTEEFLNAVKKILRRREYEVIKMILGLENEPEKSFNEVAEMMGISRSAVFQVYKNGMEKLRNSKKNRRIRKFQGDSLELDI